MLQIQENRCANAECKKVFTNTFGSRPTIDHDHSCCPGRQTCGKCVRGLLCESCNHGLGQFKDSVEKLRGAADYLEIHKNLLTTANGFDTVLSEAQKGAE
jgi:hypothetical protein